MPRSLTFSPSSGAVAPTRFAPAFVRIIRLLDAARLDFLTSSNEIHIGEEADAGKSSTAPAGEPLRSEEYCFLIHTVFAGQNDFEGGEHG